MTAGRFVVHGAHDRALVPSHCIGIEIEAATAFGTGHHGTTRGCLLALDALARGRHKPRHILDFGTGSGVLAIAAAKMFRMPVLATDIDPRRCKMPASTRSERRRRTGDGRARDRPACAATGRPRAVRSGAGEYPARPLQKLAAPVARQLDAERARGAVRNPGRAEERGAGRLQVAGAGGRALVRAGRLGDAADGGAVGLNAADHLVECRICQAAIASSQRKNAPREGRSVMSGER